MVASALFVPFAANAAPTDGSYAGTVVVNKGLTLVCTLTADVSGGGTQINNMVLTGSGGFCSSVTFNNTPYTVTTLSSTNIVIEDADVNTITAGGCLGDANATYTSNSISLAAVVPAKEAGTGDCSMEGTIELQ